MYKVLVFLLALITLVSCNTRESDKPVHIPENPAKLTPSQGMHIVGKATGRHSAMYLHCWLMELDGDTIPENVIVSEMVTDPQPLVSVYFKKKDTLIFIPVPTISGTVPGVMPLTLYKGKPDQIGIHYTRKEEGGNYTYRFAAYKFYNDGPHEVFDFQLYKILPNGKITEPVFCEVHDTESPEAEICLYDAEVVKGRSEPYLNKGPLLVKKSEKPVSVFLYRNHEEYSVSNKNLTAVGRNTQAKTGENY